MHRARPRGTVQGRERDTHLAREFSPESGFDNFSDYPGYFDYFDYFDYSLDSFFGSCFNLFVTSRMIVARNLTQRYPGTLERGPLTVLSGVDLHIERAEVVVVLGPSGSGKTTLLGLLAGLDRPTEGGVTLDGVELSQLDENGRASLRAESLGFVFQNFQLIPTLTALENVLVPLELLPKGRRLDSAAAQRRATELLSRVGLESRTGHYPAELSGGEQQRVGIARAFANEPKILFADEPTGNLDRETGHEVADLLFALNRERDTTLVIVSHDLELSQRAGRTVHLNAGRIERIEQVERTERDKQPST